MLYFSRFSYLLYFFPTLFLDFCILFQPLFCTLSNTYLVIIYCYNIHSITWHPIHFTLPWWIASPIPQRFPWISQPLPKPFHICPECLIPLKTGHQIKFASMFHLSCPDLLCSSTGPLACWFPFVILYAFLFRFHSYCTTALQHCSALPISFHYISPYSYWIANLFSHYLSYQVTQFPLISHGPCAALYSI